MEGERSEGSAKPLSRHSSEVAFLIVKESDPGLHYPESVLELLQLVVGTITRRTYSSYVPFVGRWRTALCNSSKE